MRIFIPITLLLVSSATAEDDDAFIAEDEVIVSLAPGQQLRGMNVSNSSYGEIYKFFGVPYATPPTGDRRFKPPEPAARWSGLRDARNKSAICPQFNPEDNTSVRSEDCLYLNVFSTDLLASRPVLVWIHGGAFRFGSAYHDGDGATLAPRGVVVVTINYRLGPLGFASTGDHIMPGNYGMLDQVLALKWVQKYIRVFGGDPAMVTVAGESAGAYSVSFLTLSPLSKDLFVRAIMESGSSLVPSALERAGEVYKLKDYTQKMALNLGCTGKDSTDTLQCLRNVDIDSLMQASLAAETELGSTFLMTARVETTFGFLPDYPVNLLKDGRYNKVDTLRGFNSGEWCFIIKDAENDGISRQEFMEYFKTIFTIRGSFVNEDMFTRLVAEAYIRNETDPLQLRTNLVQAAADINYGAGTIVEINKIVVGPSNSNNHFLYEFDHRASGTSTPEWCGVGHADDRQFVFFDSSNTQNNMTASDKTVANNVQAMWTNFVKFGEPTPSDVGIKTPVQWYEYTKANPVMLKINLTSTLVTYPRPFVIPMYEKLLYIMNTTIPLDSGAIIG